MTNLLDANSIRGFVQTRHTPVRRDGKFHEQTYNFTHRNLTQIVAEYQTLTSHDQHSKLLRDNADQLLRSFHRYTIEGSVKAHYRQVGLVRGEFEHVIPLKLIIDLLLSSNQLLTVPQAMAAPTCIISTEKHRELAKLKLASSTPDPINFWSRYSALNIQIETYNRIPVNQTTWDLAQHYNWTLH